MSIFSKNSLCKKFYFYTFLRKFCIKSTKIYIKNAVNGRLRNMTKKREKQRIRLHFIYFTI